MSVGTNERFLDLTIIHNILGCHGVCVHHQVRELSAQLHGSPSAAQPAEHTLK